MPSSPVNAGDYWNAVASAWPDGRDQLWRAHSDALNIALCRRWLLSGGCPRLLKTDLFDEATGHGLWQALTSLASRLDAIDTSPAVAAKARASHPGLRATAADVRALPFPDRSFDAVVSNSTLDHFDRAEFIGDALRELHRVLTRGGRLVLTLDNAAHPLVALRNALPQDWLLRLGTVPYRVGATLGPRAATTLLEHVGFRVLDVTAVEHCPRVLAVPVTRMVDRLARSAAGKARWLRALEWFEAAERWPTRLVTGHFVAVLAEKPSD